MAGMNVVRMNSAHLGAEGMARIVENCRAVSPRIGIIIDTKGPEIRTTVNAEPNEKIAFREGWKLSFAVMCLNPPQPGAYVSTIQKLLRMFIPECTF